MKDECVAAVMMYLEASDSLPEVNDVMCDHFMFY
jgi:hypothetical protein